MKRQYRRRYSEATKEEAERMLIAGATNFEVCWQTKLTYSQVEFLAEEMRAQGRLALRVRTRNVMRMEALR